MNWKRFGKAMLVGLASMAIGAIAIVICVIFPYWLLLAITFAIIVGVAYMESGEEED